MSGQHPHRTVLETVPEQDSPSTSSEPYILDTYRELRRCLIPPKPFNLSSLVEDTTNQLQQAAGHSGFIASPELECLKPINPKCVRGRREHLFYQLAALFWDTMNFDTVVLYYKDFKLFMDPLKTCECHIDPRSWRSLGNFIPRFRHLKHWSVRGDELETNPKKQKEFEEQLYSDLVWCPCYGDNKEEKRKCSVEYDQENYIVMTDFSVHCKKPCVIDIKVGRITYDPLASPIKIAEQMGKYPRLCDFGFRILGMKTPTVTKDKMFGRTLETQEQVFEAFESFFQVLETSQRKVIVIARILDRLECLLEWFETKNSNQLRFYSSSLLFVYDAEADLNIATQEVQPNLKASVKVAMIDFAHVFHSHDVPTGPSRSGSMTSIFTSGELNKDDNYLYGLRRLIKFFIMLNRQHRVRLSETTASTSATR